MSEQGEYSKQVDLLVGSHTLHGSESLCKLLRYLAKHTLEEPGARLKEYQIATEVFGRPSNFDPQLDSMIRVQAGRLRGKLADYYGSEGADDPILVELPKGTYQLQFHRRAPADGKSRSVGSNGSGRHDVPAAPIAQNSRIAIVTLCVLLALALGAIALLLANRKEAGTVLAKDTDPEAAEFQKLWKPFVTSPQEPWLIFSNAPFIGRPETGMRYYNPALDSTPILDHYTGVGEVLAVHALDQVFDMLHRQIRVKRGSLFSLDDVKNNDLIFLGSPSENLTLTEIPNTHEFVFRRLTDGPRKGDLAIINVRPREGEAATFVASPSGAPLTEDYSVIALTPGIDPARSVMIFAGTTTFGTQGAVEYVCRSNSLKELLSRLAVTKNGALEPFEALLRVKVTQGVPVEGELVAVRQVKREQK